jgi:hypothetical protein
MSRLLHIANIWRCNRRHCIERLKKSFKDSTQCCDTGSGTFIPFLSLPDPGSRIPGPISATKEEGEKKLLSYVFCSHKLSKIWIRDPGSGNNLFWIPDKGVKKGS